MGFKSLLRRSRSLISKDGRSKRASKTPVQTEEPPIMEIVDQRNPPEVPRCEEKSVEKRRGLFRRRKKDSVSGKSTTSSSMPEETVDESSRENAPREVISPQATVSGLSDNSADMEDDVVSVPLHDEQPLEEDLDVCFSDDTEEIARTIITSPQGAQLKKYSRPRKNETRNDEYKPPTPKSGLFCGCI